jgi:ketosteroid isomerase-like protein
MRKLHIVQVVLIVLSVIEARTLFAQATTTTTQPAAPTTAGTIAPVTDTDPLAAITKLREELLDSFTKADMPRMLSHLDADVVVTWQNGEVCRGPAAVQAFHDKMMSGPDRIIASLQANPKVTGRHIYGDWVVSWGEMNDEFRLKDGSRFDLHSKFTTTIARRGDAWKVTSFHASVNTFDNDVLRHTVTKTIGWAATAGLAIGLVLGVITAKCLRRKSA